MIIKSRMTHAILFLGIMSLIGCSGTAPSPSSALTTSGPPPSVAPSPTAVEPVTIAYEAWGPSQELLDQIITEFQKGEPNITVKGRILPYADYVTAIKTELASGQGPDAFSLQTGGMIREFQPLLLPIDDIAKQTLGADWAAAYRKEFLDQASVGGVPFGLPSGNQAAGLVWVNKTIFQKVGVPVPATYEDLKAAAPKLSAAGYVPLAIGAKDTWMDIDVFSAISNAIAPGKQYAAMEGQGSWTDPGLVEAFGFWQQLFKDGVTQSGAVGTTTYNDVQNLFIDGKTAMFTNGSWNQSIFIADKDKTSAYDIAVQSFPTPPGVSGSSPVISGIGNVYAVNKTSKNQAAAMKFISYLASGVGQQLQIDQSLDFASTNKDVTPAVELSANAKQARQEITALLRDHLAGYREIPDAKVKDALGEALVALAVGSIKPEDAAAAVQSAVGQ